MSDRTEWLKQLSERINIKNVEVPSDEWFTAVDLAKATNRKIDSIYRRLRENKQIENKKFLFDGKWVNFFREIKQCQEKQSKSLKKSSAKNKLLVSRMAEKLK
jgi:hypothetical protein